MRNNILIITPTLGRSPYLNETIASVAALSQCSAIQHVLVAPSGAADSLRALYPDLSVFAEPPGCSGIYAAISYVIDCLGSNFEWFAWINDDDAFTRESGLSIEECRRCAPFDLIYGRVKFVDMRGSFLFKVPVSRYTWLNNLCARVGQIPFTQQGCFIKCAKFREVGGFSTSLRLSADSDLFFRLIRAGAKLKFTAATVATYRLHSGQLSSNSVLQNAENRMLVNSLRVGFIEKFIVSVLFKFFNIDCYFGRIRRFGFKNIRAIMEIV